MTAQMTGEEYVSLEPVVLAAAALEWKQSLIFTMEDVVQAIWEHMLTEWRYYDGADDALIRHMARRAARKYCQIQRTKYMYAMGNFLYTPGQVRRYLEDVVWCSPEDCRDVEARVDISTAFKGLTRPQKAAVYKKYALREPLESKAEQSAESRGVINLTNRLNSGLRLPTISTDL